MKMKTENESFRIKVITCIHYSSALIMLCYYLGLFSNPSIDSRCNSLSAWIPKDDVCMDS